MVQPWRRADRDEPVLDADEVLLGRFVERMLNVDDLCGRVLLQLLL